MERWDAVAALAARQQGLLSRSQALDLGLAPSTLDGLVRRRGWQRVQAGVLALPGSVATPKRSVAAALLSVGEDVAAARWTAAWLWGFVPHPPSTVELLVPYRRKSPRLPRVRAIRSRSFDRADLRLRDGLVVTSPARTICELAAVTDVAFLRGVVIDARQRRLGTPQDVSCTRARMGAAKGMTTLRRVLWELDEERCDSLLERRVRKGLREHGLRPHPQPLAVTSGAVTVHIDIAFPQARVGIEVDGYGSHSSRAHLEKDHARWNLLQMLGWRILRVGWWRVETDMAGVVTELRALLAGTVTL